MIKIIFITVMLLFCGIAYSGSSINTLAGTTATSASDRPVVMGLRIEHGYNLYNSSYIATWWYTPTANSPNKH